MRFFSNLCLFTAVGLQLAAVQPAQAKPATFVCDPTIARNAAERHAMRIKLAKDRGLPIDLPELEAATKSRVERLCKIDIQTQENRQAVAALVEKEQSDAHLKEVNAIMAKIEKNTHHPGDVRRLTQLYGLLNGITTPELKPKSMPDIAQALRKLGVTVD